MQKIRVLIFLLFGTVFLAAAQDEARLLRFPAIHGDQVVFTYAGDLYTVDKAGGLARKLTNHKGFEMFARFSPDGSQLAFTGQYDGNTEVFLMPAQGGVPKRLTYTATLSRDEVGDRMGPNNIVMTWSPDGKQIVYRSRRYSFNSFRGQLFAVSPQGGLSDEIPLHNGGWCTYSPDGKKLAFNRVFREFRTWKYYTGGMTDDVWIYDFNSKQVKNITEKPSQDIFPMWIGKEIYFLSDRDRRMNLFVYNTETQSTEKVTDFKEYDIKFPSAGGNQIVFENGGFIYIFDTRTKTHKKLTVQIANDQLSSRPALKDATKHIEDAQVSPNGKRIVFCARGDVFSVPAKQGITRNLTQSSGSHERSAVYSPDGKYIAYLSDKSGEYEIYLQKTQANQPPVQLTKNGETYKYSIKWSPDSKKILWSDRKFRLRYVNIENKKITQVDTNGKWEYRSYAWSPDSRWIAFVRPEFESMNKIYIFDTEKQKSTEVTQGWYSVGNPVFSCDGKYLFFSSARTFDPIYSQTEWNHAYTDMTKLYLVTLQKDTPSPFAPENDEVKSQEEDMEKDDQQDDKEKKDDKAKEVKIDFDGIKDRTLELPVEASNYGGLYSVGSKIYFHRRGHSSKLEAGYYDLENQKEKIIGVNFSFSISANGKKMLVRKSRKKYAVISVPSGKASISDYADLSEIKVKVDYAQEWQQIFDESWRQMRDFFFAPNMHGVDWKAMHEKYGKLVPHVRHRDDLTYIIGELIGELNIGHAYVNSGEKPKPERIKTGLLGAKFSRHSSGFFKIEHILQGANWSSELCSPLKELGVKASEGDYIIAINGNSVKNTNNLFELMVGTAGKTIELTLNSEPSRKGAWTSLVKPIGDESKLYYYNWVQNNIRKVNQATDGKVGYIHIPDMSQYGLNEFVKHFYPQMRKKALIIDDRGNGGGNVSPMIIERLNREMVLTSVARNQTKGSPNPSDLHLGPKVMLINNYSASDGDLFPYRFKSLNMGTVIGMRTWGAITGIRGSLPFVDGGDLRKPEYAKYDVQGKNWVIEGQGVSPDIKIDNNPALEYQGTDQQLQKAIEVILKQLEEFDKGVKPIPPYPDKSK